MTFEIITSLIDPKKEKETLILKEYFSDLSLSENFEWILYLWYPIVTRWDENLKLDAIWISQTYWIIIFSILTENSSQDNIKYGEDLQKKIYWAIYSKMVNTDWLADIEIWSYPKPKINISIITFAPFLDKSKFIEKRYFWLQEKALQNYSFALDKSDLLREIGKINSSSIDLSIYDKTISTIQDIINLKTKKNRKITRATSKWSKLEKIEETMAQLDAKQEKTILWFFDWIQRIRWLAWSGKTIILSLKIALFHSSNPWAKIAVTFNTRAQKQQFESLIKKFCISKMWKEPDWDKIKVIQAWGSPSSEGIYYNFCIQNGLRYYDFRQSKILADEWYNWKELIDTVCTAALSELKSKWKESLQLYDIIFIDEAQDLSASFLELCYKSLHSSNLWKRKLVYAYDELQKLNEWSSLPEPKDIFWIEIDSDDILSKCYRNSKEVITTAHALWLWIYREGWLVQFFNNPVLWKDIWYLIEDNMDFTAGQDTVLSRTWESSPSFFNDFFESQEFVNFHKFTTKDEQYEWIATQIENDLKNEDLLAGDIMVINPNALTTKKEAGIIRNKLFEKWIKSHIAWEVNADIFYEDHSVVLTWINRAKWNEVGMVYIINADDCFQWEFNNKYNLQKLRNILFTAITRSKAWVQVCWTWGRMEWLTKEFDTLKRNNYKLRFPYPSNKEIENLNTVYKTINQDEGKERKEIKKNATYSILSIKEIINNIKNDNDSLDNYSEEEQELLRQLLL